MITENLSTLKINRLTQAQYDRELDAGNINETAIYLTPDRSITPWQPYTLYKADDVVLANVYESETEMISTELCYCIEKHKSSSDINGCLNFDTDARFWIRHQLRAVYDAFDNHIHSTYATKDYVDNYLGGLSGGIIRIIVDTLPTNPSEINENAIYMIPSQDGTENNIYDEYMFFDDNGVLKPEIIGSTAVDLSNYYTKAEIEEVAQAFITRESVESDYYNAMTVDELIRNNIKLWQPNTEYNVGDVVIANLQEELTIEDNFYAPDYPYRTVIAKCVGQHTSINFFSLSNNGFQDTWEIMQETKAYYDAFGRGIHNTYATKEEIGDIKAVLDELHNYAQTLITEGVE